MRDDRVWLMDLLSAAACIREFLQQKTRDDFNDDRVLQSALLHQLSVITEAAAHVSQALQQKYPKVQWSAMRGMRNVIVHEYFSLDLDIIWETVIHDIPELAAEIKQILKAEFRS